jgi:hypothetical protein
MQHHWAGFDSMLLNSQPPPYAPTVELSELKVVTLDIPIHDRTIDLNYAGSFAKAAKYRSPT